MTYQEAQQKAPKYNITEWDFGTVEGFVFAVEFFEKEALRKQQLELAKQKLNGHNFHPNRRCIYCGVSELVFYNCIHSFSCETIRLTLNRGVPLDTIEKRMREECRSRF
jgi:hypothetical protein